MSLGASSQRVAYANLYANIGSDKLSEVRDRKASTVNSIESYASGLFDYYVSDDVYDFLASKGLPLSINCFRTHSHPISKMIENHFIFNLIGNNLAKDSTFISFKEDKLVLLKNKKSRIDGNTCIINRLVHAKDALRYKDPLRNLWFDEDQKTMKGLAESDRVIIHDEVHYWNLKDFQRFLSYINCPLIYTVIYPAELHGGYPFSLYPELYDFRVSEDGKTFTWMPDGKCCGSYKQPVNPWLLSTNKTMDLKGRTWTLTKLESVGSHHLFLCTPGDLVTEDEAVYNDFTLVDPKLFSSLTQRMPKLRASYMHKVIHYLMALKKPDAASAVSKLRQLSKGDETTDEMIFSGTIATQIAELKYFTEVGGLIDLTRALKVGFARLFGQSIEYFLNKKWYHLDCFTNTVQFMVKAEVRIKMGYKPMVDGLGPEHKVLEPAGLEMRREYQGLRGVEAIADGGVPERKRQPYSMIFSDCERMCDAGDPVGELNEFKRMLGHPNNCEHQKWMYFEATPTPGQNFVYQEVAKDIYIKVYLITNPPLHELLLEGLITLEEYKSMRGQLPGTETSIVVRKDEVQETEADDSFDNDMVKLKEIKKNLCLIQPIAEHFALKAPVLISKATVEIPNFARYLSDKGLSMPGLYMLCKNMGLTLSIISDEGYLHLQGSYKPLGLVIKDDHATPGRYIQRQNRPAEALAVNPGVGQMEIEVVSENARALQASFEKGFTGLILNDHRGKWAAKIPQGAKAKLTVSVCLGFAGSGKTSSITQMLKLGHQMDVAVVSPRKNLCEEWKKELLDTDVCVYTYESFLLNHKHKLDLLILDEIPLFPPGYIDLVHFIKNVEHILLLGDPLQTSYHADGDALTLSGVEGDIFRRLQAKKSGICPCGMHFKPSRYMGPNVEFDFDKADKLKGREAIFFSRGGEGYKYNGGDHKSSGWIGELDQIIDACNINADSFDHCLVQRYIPGGSIKPHADNEPIYPADNPILTVQLTGSCTFTLSCRKGDTSLHLEGAQFFLMPNGCQKGHKHSVVAHDHRVSLTFRSTRPLELMSGKIQAVPYLFLTNRLSSKQKIMEVPSYGMSDFEVKEIKKLNKETLTICFSRATVEEERDNLTICTVGQAQGLSRDVVQIMFDHGSLKCADETIITALTRARKAVHLFYKIGKADLKNCSSPILRAFISNGKIPEKLLVDKVKGKLGDCRFLTENVFIGADSATIEDHLVGDPGLKAMLLILEAEEMEPEIFEEETVPETIRTHLGVTTFANEQFAFGLKAKEEREHYIHGTGFSAQIRDNIASEFHPGPSAPSSIYLHHTAEDDVLFILSIKKRLRFADFEKNCASFERKKKLGESIFTEFLKRADFMNFTYPPQVDETSMELDFTMKRIQKSARILEAHSYRSDADWPSNYLKIFIKNQDCTKMEKRGSDAKAGQTIACFSHAVLCKFGPILRKTEAQLRKILPPHVMIFSQKNYEDLDKWSKDYFNDHSGTDSDYEAFDRSQDGAILAFEICLLRHFLWPEELIEEYKTLKLMMGCQLGDLAVMRFSGEFGTFFFNTMCNMAFSYLRYQLGPYQPIAFAGDDMVAPGRLVVNESMNSVLNQLELKAKVNYSDSPLFCGWRMSPYGIVKDPNLLLDRLEMKRAEGKLDDCIANYALEASYGYRLSDHLYDLNIDLDAFQELIRKIVMLKHKLPPAIASLFKDEEDIVSSDEEA
uniref:ORF1 protein n=1 Tax=Grapevine virus E TaxID=516956 RepID=A0A6B9SCW8_9VIRU|nr:replicase [Grapevine virus E]UGS43987.1 replicase [Grapevine virus E]